MTNTKETKVDDENIYKYLNLTEEDIQTIEERCEILKEIEEFKKGKNEDEIKLIDELIDHLKVDDEN